MGLFHNKLSRNIQRPTKLFFYVLSLQFNLICFTGNHTANLSGNDDGNEDEDDVCRMDVDSTGVDDEGGRYSLHKGLYHGFASEVQYQDRPRWSGAESRTKATHPNIEGSIQDSGLDLP